MGFKRLEADDFVVSAQAQTQTCWTGNEPALTVDSMFTTIKTRLMVNLGYIMLLYLTHNQELQILKLNLR